MELTKENMKRTKEKIVKKYIGEEKLKNDVKNKVKVIQKKIEPINKEEIDYE